MTYMPKIIAYAALAASLALVFSVTSHGQDFSLVGATLFSLR